MNLGKLKVLLLAALVVTFTACYPDDSEISNSSGTPKGADPYLDINALVGTWKLETVTQVDESAVLQKQPDYMQRLVLSDLYSYDVTLNLSRPDSTGKFAPYTVTQNGEAPFYIPGGTGQWRLNLNVTPSINMKNADTAMAVFPAPAFRASDNKLTLRIDRIVSGAKASSYVYAFTRSN
jgi:hypothetical protein